MIEVEYRCAWQWHWPELNILFNVSKQANNIFQANRQLGRRAHECGGQLFVSIDNDGEFWMFATPPHTLDKCGSTWLELDASRCKAEIIEANVAGFRLVGYWHTHPQEVPALSSRDIASLATFSERNKGILEKPVAVIVGRSSNSEGIRAWSHQSPRSQILAVHETKALAENSDNRGGKDHKASDGPSSGLANVQRS